MISIDLISNDKIKNFIYDNSNKKLLIGTRRGGKTSSLMLTLAKNCSNKNSSRKSAVITPINLKFAVETLEAICNELNITITEKTKISNSKWVLDIESSKVTFIKCTSYSNGRMRGIAYDDIYIDEPNFISDFNELLKEIECQSWRCENDSKIIIAGSSHCNCGENLKKLNTDLEFSKHTVLPEDIQSYNLNLERLEKEIGTDKFKTEILCEFI